MLYLDSQFESIRIQYDEIDQSGQASYELDDIDLETANRENRAEMTDITNQNTTKNNTTHSNLDSTNNKNVSDNMTSDNVSASTTSNSSRANSTAFATALSHLKEPDENQRQERVEQPVNELMTDDERDSNLSY